MGLEKLQELIPSQGFLKVGKSKEGSQLSSADRVKLVRRGNQFLQEGRIEAARRIFITTGNTNGLISVGDHYLNEKKELEALKMYAMAPAPDKIEAMAPGLANILHLWLHQEEHSTHE